MQKLPKATTTPRRMVWRFARRTLLFLGVAVALLAGLLLEEYWRGKRAWERCKAELASKGAVLDWETLNPIPIPKEDDFFAVPGMMEWFGTTGSNALPARLRLPELETTAGPLNNYVLARIEVVPADAEVSEKDVDLVLRYSDSLVSLSTFGPVDLEATDSSSAILPLIVMDQVPLTHAIQHLARNAGLNYLLDPRTGLCGQKPPPLVTIRWENVTARQALDAVLDHYALERVDTHQGISRIQPKDYSGRKIFVEPSAREQLQSLLNTALESAGNQVPLRGLIGSENISLLREPLSSVTPLRVVVRTDEPLAEKDLEQFFPTTPFASICESQNCYRVTPWTAGAYRLWLPPNRMFTAADYLAWSERCQADFDRIRQALQRPGANLPAVDLQTCVLPVRNLVAARIVAQMLTQRAQSHLLLDQPEAALRELTLLYDLRRILTCKPVTLVAAMSHVAVTGILVEAVRDGLELNAWTEAQLTVIEAQLQQINLVPAVIAGFQLERFSVLQMLETGRLSELYRLNEDLALSMSQPGEGQHLRRARYALLSLVPRGWVYQNMATIGSLHQGFLDAADGPAGVILLPQIDAAARQVQDTIQLPRPETFIARAAFGIQTRAWQAVERNQELVREVLAACRSRHDLLARASRPSPAL